MNDITFKTLSHIGYSKYILTAECRLYITGTKPIEIKRDTANRFYLISDSGKGNRISQKELYKKVYNKEFCYDSIKNLNGEQWKEITGTQGKYFISNCGRVKSYCGYIARILKPYQKKNGYLIVKILGKNIMIHRLVAFNFCENKYNNQKVEIHHIDFNRQNNYYKNLIILSTAEHHKIHNKKDSNI